TNKDAPLFLVDAGDLAHNYHRIFLVPQYSTDWRTDLGRTQHRCRHLIKQRLKQVVICPIDQDITRRRVVESFGSSQTTETSAYNHDARCAHVSCASYVNQARVTVCHVILSIVCG